LSTLVCITVSKTKFDVHQYPDTTASPSVTEHGRDSYVLDSRENIGMSITHVEISDEGKHEDFRGQSWCKDGNTILDNIPIEPKLFYNTIRG
jgi:hypothetical protein